MVTKTTLYKTEDGCEFEDEWAATAHEHALMKAPGIDEFVSWYCKEHDLTERTAASMRRQLMAYVEWDATPAVVDLPS